MKIFPYNFHEKRLALFSCQAFYVILNHYTDVMISAGATAGHIDHVKTQMPYALVCAAVASVAYLIVGFTMV